MSEQETENKETGAKTEEKTPEVKENLISIDDFAKVELKIARIIKAEPHPNADRLLKLQISLGDEERQICAGIKASYEDLDALVGKYIAVVANLKPIKLRGEESRGMLLAVSDSDGKAVLLTPDKADADIKAGTLVK
jgi:methionyl-tRNA synthetase